MLPHQHQQQSPTLFRRNHVVCLYITNEAFSGTPSTQWMRDERYFPFLDVCRLRLDYETFQLTAASTAHPFGQCITEYMAVSLHIYKNSVCFAR